MAQYTVAQGDNLSKIASQNNTTVQNLASLNNIQDVNKINVGQKLNLSAVAPVANAPIALGNITEPAPQQIKVTQPQVSTGSTLLQSDIISKGQADTARAVAEEARISTLQGTKAPTATENVLKNILGQSSTTAPQTQGTAPTGDAINVNGITSDTMASQRQGIQDTLSNITGETRLTANEYAGTVDPAKAELKEINARMNDEALAGRRRIEAILQTPGVTKQSAGDMINEIQRTNASTLADLAVVQMAKQGAYEGAKEIADRAVQAKVEDQKNKLNALMFTYTENKELFTKAEQRQFEIAQGDRKRKLDAEEKNLQRISDLSLQALQDGAPTSVVTKMRNAKTESEAIIYGGQYIGALDRKAKNAQIAQSQASTAKIYQDIAESKIKNMIGTGNLKQLSYEDNARLNSTPQAKVINDGVRYASALDNYKDAIKKYGTGEVFGTGKGTLGEAYQALVGVVKDYYTLGTYDNGVEKLIGMGIAKPGVFQLSSKQFGALDSAKDEVASTLDRNINQLSSTLYNNSVEGQTLIQTGKAVTDVVNLSKKNNQDFLNSLESVSGTTTAVNNQSFFNK